MNHPRLQAFTVLLDIRYLPLLFAAAPQSYSVFLWLWHGSDLSQAAYVFAILGALGFEFVYVGAIAWAEHQAKTNWTWITAASALVFSILVAIYVHSSEGYWAALHAGFPFVAFCYTMAMHAASLPQPERTASADPAPPAVAVQVNVAAPAQLPQTVREFVRLRAAALLTDDPQLSMPALAVRMETSYDMVRRALSSKPSASATDRLLASGTEGDS